MLEKDFVERLRARGLRVEADLSSDKLGAKIRNARLLRYPYMLVVGEREAAEGRVAVRARTGGEEGSATVAEFAERALEEVRTKGKSPEVHVGTGR